MERHGDRACPYPTERERDRECAKEKVGKETVATSGNLQCFALFLCSLLDLSTFAAGLIRKLAS